MESWIRHGTAWLASAIDVVAALIIAWAALATSYRLIRARGTWIEGVRLHFGRWLLLGLEFLLAADILRSTVSPSWNDLGQLAAVVVIRTVLDYFLVRDVAAAGRQPAPP